MSFGTLDTSSLGSSAQAFCLDAARSRTSALAMFYHPETETHEEIAYFAGTPDLELIVEGALESVRLNLKNAAIWLQALPIIQNRIIGMVEESDPIVNPQNGDIFLTHIFEGNEDLGKCIVAIFDKQGNTINMTGGYYSEGQLFVPVDYNILGIEDCFDENDEVVKDLCWFQSSTGKLEEN